MKTAVKEQRQRGIERLQSYWEQLADGRAMPAEAEVEATQLESIWENCFLVNVKHDGRSPGYHYSYLGHSLLDAFGLDAGDEGVLEKLVAPHSQHMTSLCDEVMRTGKPVSHESSFVNRRKSDIRYRCCLVPLSGDYPGEIGYILGTMDWRAY